MPSANIDYARAAYQQALVILDDLDRPDATQVRAKLRYLNQPDRRDHA